MPFWELLLTLFISYNYYIPLKSELIPSILDETKTFFIILAKWVFSDSDILVFHFVCISCIETFSQCTSSNLTPGKWLLLQVRVCKKTIELWHNVYSSWSLHLLGFLFHWAVNSYENTDSTVLSSFNFIRVIKTQFKESTSSIVS